MKIMVIEDEPKLGSFICAGLTQNGHVCDHIKDGAAGLEALMVNAYDLLLLDLMLPGMNGFDVLKNLQSLGNTVPVIILSALGDTENVIKGLDLGAIDYLRKPFELDELLARVRAVQRRNAGQQTAKLKFEDVEMDLYTREVTRAGREITLSNREFALLEFLVNNANRVVTKTQILEKVWDMNFDPGSNVIEVHLYQLRKKIDKDADHPLIHTVIGRGYTIKGKTR
ncbi:MULTISPECIES: response regulator transcription factor [unclassified Mucilaginibacter]|uniref:response regulator transcription factor n=1 Tax=unclassified Mucilaginibacter TaxID=2617802 RepID=UPI0009664D74|nr:MULTISPECIES: response regulator transcription factor [unclassified Mucilaginibacter]OJW13576.1 MAG: DNA-binding response regulator [Mucilaginibacter sp. 44-25]PLW89927.1 MAG: DNA-binding response regulator [Mucilaginibacter sp.]HEK21538.1 response regulator transcription factor [Bacteroidota bacterium]